MNSIEIWKDAYGFEEFYQVSNYGKIKNIKRDKLLKPYKTPKGYIQLTLTKNGTPYYTGLHHLMALTFLPNPNNYRYVNHKDENPTNNFIFINPDGSVDQEKSNLEWCDLVYNVTYGTANKRRKNNGWGRGKPVLQYTLDGELIREWESALEVERQTGWDNSLISRCTKGKSRRKTAYGFIWKHKN